MVDSSRRTCREEAPQWQQVDFLVLNEVQSFSGPVARVVILNRLARSYRFVRHEAHNLLVVAIGVCTSS